MVAIDNLKEKIAVTDANLKQQKENVRAMARQLESGAQTVSFDGHPYDPRHLSDRISRDLTSCKRCEKELTFLRATLESKESGLAAARERLETVRTQKEELEAMVEQLEADLKQVRTAQAKSKFAFDDSQLARCKEALQEIRNRLNVEKKTTELEGRFANDFSEPEAKGKSVSEVTKEVRDYLGGASTEEGVASSRK
jgi:DNA repair exonuclease SbcCD ATPase subunit